MTDGTISAREVRAVVANKSEQLNHDQSPTTRSDPRRRRRWLRDLDSSLGGELEEAGALSCRELAELAAQPLRGRGSLATIEEWWEYAHRRSWIEEHGDNRGRLTPTGLSGLHVRRKSDAVIDSAVLGRAILKWLLPAGVIGVTGYLVGRNAAFTATILVIITGVALGLILVAPLMRWFDRVMNRQDARRACDWLDDRSVWRLRGRDNPTRPAKRLYDDGNRSAPGFSVP